MAPGSDHSHLPLRTLPIPHRRPKDYPSVSHHGVAAGKGPEVQLPSTEAPPGAAPELPGTGGLSFIVALKCQLPPQHIDQVLREQAWTREGGSG